MSQTRPVSINLYDMTNGAISSGTVLYIFRGAIDGNIVHQAGTTTVTITSGTATTSLAAPDSGSYPYDLIIQPGGDAMDYSFLLPYGDGGTVNVATLITSANNPVAPNLYEPQLGNPAASGNILSSTIAGVRSWIAATAVGAVSSVFGRTGAVVATTGDYNTNQITDMSLYGGGDLTTALNSGLQHESDTTNIHGIPDTADLAVTGANTFTGEQNLADNLLTRPKIKDYGETVNAIGGTGGGTQDIDLTLGNVVTATVDTSANTFTFSNPPATGIAGSFTLILTNGGSQTVTWPAAVKWAGGTAPTLTTAGVDILTFVTVDAGTTWYGFAAGLDMS